MILVYILACEIAKETLVIRFDLSPDLHMRSYCFDRQILCGKKVSLKNSSHRLGHYFT